MVQDAMKFAKACQAVKYMGIFYTNHHNYSTQAYYLGPSTQGGSNVIGLLKPASSRGHMFILATTDYFSKWAEAISIREVGAK